MRTGLYSIEGAIRARGINMRPKLDLTDEQRRKLAAYKRRDEELAGAFEAGIASERIEPSQPVLFEDPATENTDVLATLYISSRGNRVAHVGDYQARPAGWRRIPLVEKTPANLPVGYVPLPVEPTREIMEAFEAAQPGAFLSLRAYAALVKTARETFDPSDNAGDDQAPATIHKITMAQARTAGAFYAGIAHRDIQELIPVVQGSTNASAAAVKRAKDKLLATVVEHADDILEALRAAATTLEPVNSDG